MNIHNIMPPQKKKKNCVFYLIEEELKIFEITRAKVKRFLIYWYCMLSFTRKISTLYVNQRFLEIFLTS